LPTRHMSSWTFWSWNGSWMKIAQRSCTYNLKESSKPNSASSCRRFCIEHNKIKYNTMCHLKTKLVLLKFRFLKTYEA
jgi:hypothetical protein